MKEKEKDSIIDLGKCEEILKDLNGLDQNDTLILIKYEKLTNISLQKNIQYEVYNSKNISSKLDLNVCNTTKIDIYIPSSIDKNSLFKYNISSDFYNDKCFPYSSGKNTDIILNDRREEYMKKNMSLCEDNCEYKYYDVNQDYAKCECNIKTKFNFLPDIEIDKNKLLKKFKNFEDFTNIYVLKCYKRLFSEEGLKNNIGSYILLSIIFVDIILFLVFKIIGYQQLIIKVKYISDFQKEKEFNDGLHSPRKIVNKSSKNKKQDKNNKNKERKINSNKKTKKGNPPKNKLKIKNKSFQNKNKDKSKKKMESFSNIDSKNNLKIIFNKENNTFNNYNLKTESNIILNDYELNSLSYKKALKIDKRTYIKYYISLLKRKQLIIFIFFVNDDYNSKIIKIIYVFIFIFFILYNKCIIFY